MIYFAYGSNMHPERLRQRVPSREVIATSVLSGFRLTFHKRGGDGSGKCAVLPAEASAAVHGVIYRMSPSHRPALDLAENTHGGGYVATEVAVDAPDGRRFEAFTYVPPSNQIDASLKPFDWYKAFVVEGARHHGLPQDYLDELLGIHAIADQNAARAALNRKILAALMG
ncbi:MAG: gamma-glutamylcyclotransferase family protein [Pseudomonadota bacterium]